MRVKHFAVIHQIASGEKLEFMSVSGTFSWSVDWKQATKSFLLSNNMTYGLETINYSGKL